MEITIANQTYMIQHIQTGEEILRILQKEKPKFFTYDTETTGLHVKADKPFTGGICFKNKVFLFDTSYDILKWFPKWADEVGTVIGHNVCFDLNMNCNVIGEEYLKSKKVRYMDTMNLVQLAVESKSERRGGIKLGLKHLGKEYIDPRANDWEMTLKKELKSLETSRQRYLTAYLKGIGWTKKKYQEYLKDGQDLTEEVKEVVAIWEEEHPSPTYQDVPDEILYPYLAVDVILTKLLAEKCFPIIKHRKQENALKIESGIIPIVVRMARIGMEVDQEYLKESGRKLESEITKCYEELWKLTESSGFKFSSGQHAQIKKYYSLKGTELESSDSDHLGKIGDREATLIIKLRTLEKWLSTYVRKILVDSAYDGRFYSLLNPFKAVSGRFSGDCQQFPKFPLEDDNGEEIFYPRRAFAGHWAFCDFSQQELRVATHYAIQLGVEDFNLFRAYMPYKCQHYKTGEIYSKDAHDWQEQQETGESAWLTETREAWKPTDLHSATAFQTINLLKLGIKKEDKDFKKWRQLSKITNFAKLYGAQAGALQAQLGVDRDTANALSEGYYQAFPSLKVYADKINVAMHKKGYVENLYGRRYYMSDPSDFYRAGNMIIQGSCAYDVKAKMIRIQDYLDSVNAKTQIVLTIHDEIVYTKVDGEEWVIDECIKIMEDDSMLKIPLVSEKEVTETYWSAKK